MPLDHTNATATVSISGLALGCYNKSTQNYEVALLRHDKHHLTIEVKKYLPDGESTMLYEIKDCRHRIFIDAENAVAPQEPFYTVGDDFDRRALGADPEDFRWVVDFEKDLNCGKRVKLKHCDVHVTEMYVAKPRLYAGTDLFTQDPYFLVRLDPETNEPVPNEDPVLFGFFSEEIKADITCQDGGAVVLRVDGPQGFHVALPPGNQPHEITIKNICPPKAKEEDGDTSDNSDITGDGSDPLKPTDFRLFYSLIVDTDGNKYDVKPPPNHGEGAVCNASTLGTRGSLFPLPPA